MPNHDNLLSYLSELSTPSAAEIEIAPGQGRDTNTLGLMIRGASGLIMRYYHHGI
jgi:hypothetical protein